MTILIEELSNDEFHVIVKDKNLTTHKVILTDNNHLELTNGKINKKKLIEFSFKFLLKRENNTSILSSFELSVISNYFPDYIKFVKEYISNY